MPKPATDQDADLVVAMPAWNILTGSKPACDDRDAAPGTLGEHATITKSRPPGACRTFRAFGWWLTKTSSARG